MIYPLLRRILFSLEPERSHALTLSLLNVARHLKLWQNKVPSAPCQVFGLQFKHPVGLAAGFDKNGDFIDLFNLFGLSFIEIGTVTPQAQIGNQKPRLFRLPNEAALINRMGFNNKGIDYLIERVKASHYRGVLGISLGKNATTPLDHALDDYLIGIKKASPYADYLVINISSPNTKGLRTLQQHDYLNALLSPLKSQCTKPLLVKVSPDLSEGEINMMADVFLLHGIDGVIATNTTLHEQGGLSGLPLAQKSTAVLRLFNRALQGKIPLIASGGVMNAPIALEKFKAGASLVQIYTGLIYRGPRLINEIVNNSITS